MKNLDQLCLPINQTGTGTLASTPLEVTCNQNVMPFWVNGRASLAEAFTLTCHRYRMAGERVFHFYCPTVTPGTHTPNCANKRIFSAMITTELTCSWWTSGGPSWGSE